MAKKPTPQRERFFKHVVQRDGCWGWGAYKLPSGHGQFDGRLAHDLSYEFHIGSIPAGMRVDHSCGNLDCTNPAHLGLTSTPVRTGVPAKSLREKFERHVIRCDGCWGWSGSKSKFGYGLVRGEGGRPVGAHRVSYEMFVGPIGRGMSILHSCDNPECTNPRHLRAGTQAENMRDMAVRGRSQRGDRHYNVRIQSDDLVDIRVLRSFGVSYGVIAREYGVSRSAVRARLMNGG